jgi:hypothetical protein
MSSDSIDHQPRETGPVSEREVIGSQHSTKVYIVNPAGLSDNVSEDDDLREEEPPTPLGLFDVSSEWKLLKPLFSFAAEEISHWCKKLDNTQILFIISYDGAVLSSGAKEIAYRLKERFSPRLFKGLSEAEQDRVDPTLRQGDRPALIVVDAALTIPRFLERTLYEQGRFEGLRQSLLGNDCLLLVLTNDRCLGWSEDQERMRTEEAYVHCIRVKFLPPRLRSEFEDWEPICAEVLKQRGDGQWATDDELFYQEIDTALRGGKDKLLEEIQRRREGRVPTAARSQADGLLSPRRPLENAALFVATFFPNLPRRDFERVLLELLGQQEVLVASPFLVVGPDGDGHTEERRESHLLRDLWHETYPEVLARCYLQTVRDMKRGDGSPSPPIVDFATPELRSAFRDSFFGSHSAIFQELFHALRDAREILSESAEIANLTVRLVVDTAVLDRREFSGPGLGGWLSAPHPSDDLHNREEPPGPPVLWSRFLPCLRAFLQTPTLRDLVTGRYLPDLFTAQRYADILELAWVLRDTAGFAAFPWLERLCNEGDDDAWRRVGVLLRRAVRQTGAAEILRAVYSWLPPSGAQISKKSAAGAARGFFIGLNEGLLFHAGTVRSRPAGNPLLVAAQRAGSEDLAELFISWLFHTASAAILEARIASHSAQWVRSWLVPQPVKAVIFEQSLGDRFVADLQHRWEETEEDELVRSAPIHALFFPAVVVADWAVELLVEDPPSAPARAFLDRLLAALARVCSGERRLALEILWSAIEESLVDVEIWLEELDPRPAEVDSAMADALRAVLGARRRAVRQLRLDFRSCALAVAC